MKEQIFLAVLVGTLFALFGYFWTSENPDNHKIPVNQSGEYRIDNEAILDENGRRKFDVNIKQGKYKISRMDRVRNPAYGLSVDKAYVVGETLVIEEEFVKQNDDNIVAPTVISYGGYNRGWNLDDLKITRVAVYHPYNDRPYVRDL